jgi:hypothetical protein
MSAVIDKPLELNTQPSVGLRASPPTPVLSLQLGPLADLPGTWVGRGFNIVALPDFAGGKIFQLKVAPTMETLTFSQIGGPIPNRGDVQPDLFFLGLHYLQQVSNGITNAGMHLEPGLWLNLPDVGEADQGASVARLATVPHGDAILARGPSFNSVLPIISPVDATPFSINAVTGARENVTADIYLAAYRNAALPVIDPPLPANVVLNPNLLLQQSNDQLAANGQKIVNTVVLIVNANPVGGINGTPIVPPADAVPAGGMLNIPFVNANANANATSAIFWIETIQNQDGTEFLQLQYTQTILLEFKNLKWPHISVATLIKQ